MSDQEVIFRDFTRVRKPVAFGISGVKYDCVVALGTDALQELMAVYRGGDLQELLKAKDADAAMDFVRSMFKIFLLDDSFPRFVEKLRDRKDPVDIHQLLEIVAWVVEVYTKDQSPLSAGSSDTSQSDETGTSLTAGAQLEGEILSNSIATVS